MGAKAVPTVFVVDDDPGIRHSIHRLLTSLGVRVEAFSSARTFLDAFGGGTHGCVVSDVRLPDMSGVELQEELRRRGSAIPVIVITGYADVDTAVRSMRMGAVDFIEKPIRPNTLVARIREAVQEDRARLEREAGRRAVLERLKRLTAREREVLDLVVEGRTSREIANQLGLSPRTVHVHRAEARSKMQAGSIAELTRMVVTALDI